MAIMGSLTLRPQNGDTGALPDTVTQFICRVEKGIK
jgi:hypothetical protein